MSTSSITATAMYVPRGSAAVCIVIARESAVVDAEDNSDSMVFRGNCAIIHNSANAAKTAIRSG